MTAYSFQDRFVEPIWRGTKTHTLREPRRGKAGHAKPGGQLQLYNRMRRKDCRLIARAVCSRQLSPVIIDFRLSTPIISVAARWICDTDELNDFAIADGFEDIDAMVRYWRDGRDVRRHEDLVLIGWDPTYELFESNREWDF